jgi:hypothetical protein
MLRKEQENPPFPEHPEHPLSRFVFGADHVGPIMPKSSSRRFGERSLELFGDHRWLFLLCSRYRSGSSSRFARIFFT